MDGSGFSAAALKRDVPGDMAERLIVALDVDHPDIAKDLVRQLDGVVSFFKIGMGLFIAEGTESLIDHLVKSGKNVFLDYKMFDIGETVKQGVIRARDRGVKFVTVHGDQEIMRAAVEGRGTSDFLKIFSITVLTSLNDDDLKEMGYALSVEDLIRLRVRNSLACGCDGIIASAHDRPDDIRKLFNADGLLIATPGIRPPGASLDDHKRSATPAQAIRAGADYLVVGRPIVGVENPRQAAIDIVSDMKGGTALS